jgi:hypothetical protein
MSWLPWFLLLHLVGAFAFVLGHGASAMVAMRLRAERNPERVRALLDLSSSSISAMYVGLLLLLIGGIAAGFAAGSWGRLWIWTALVLLIAITGAMYPLGSLHYAKVRRAVGMRTFQDKKDAPLPEPVSAAELDALLAGNQPILLAAIGGGGLLIIIFLMILKPF